MLDNFISRGQISDPFCETIQYFRYKVHKTVPQEGTCWATFICSGIFYALLVKRYKFLLPPQGGNLLGTFVIRLQNSDPISEWNYTKTTKLCQSRSNLLGNLGRFQAILFSRYNNFTEKDWNLPLQGTACWAIFNSPFKGRHLCQFSLAAGQISVPFSKTIEDFHCAIMGQPVWQFHIGRGQIVYLFSGTI